MTSVTGRQLLGSVHADARTFSQQPKSRCHQLLQQPSIESADPTAGHAAFANINHFM